VSWWRAVSLVCVTVIAAAVLLGFLPIQTTAADSALSCGTAWSPRPVASPDTPLDPCLSAGEDGR
jgi:hypothetical protein